MNMLQCDFCLASDAPEQLRAYPCADFMVFVAASGSVLHADCVCHSVVLPLDSESPNYRCPCEGEWLACRECGLDIDAEQWSSVLRRFRSVAQRDLGAPPSTLDLLLRSKMYELFQRHRVM